MAHMTHFTRPRLVILTPLLGLVLVFAATAFADDPLTSAAPAQAPAANGQDELPSLKERIKKLEARPLDLAGAITLLREDLSKTDERRVRRSLQRAAREDPTSPRSRFLAGLAKPDHAGLTKMAAALVEGIDATPAVERAAWRTLRDASDGRDAAIHAQAAVEVAARSKTNADLLIQAQAQAKLPGHAAEAISTYQALLVKDEGNLTARTDLALLLAQDGQTGPALKWAEETATRYPDSATAFLYLGMVRSLTGDPDGGRAAYAKALTCTDRNANALAAVAAAYTQLEDYEHAEQALSRALAVEPRHVGALSALAVLELQRGLPKKALTHLTTAARVAPRDARIQFLRGVAYERCERYGPAATAYRAALRLQPERVSFTLALARALERKGSSAVAVSEVRKALARVPDDTRLLTQLGFLQLRRRRYMDALDAFRSVARLKPEDPSPWFFMAVIHGDHRSKPREALAALQRYQELGGKEPTALAWLARLTAALGSKAKKTR